MDKEKIRKIIRFDDELFEEVIPEQDGYVFKSVDDFHNPMVDMPLNEGLQMTYPIEQTITKLKNRFRYPFKKQVNNEFIGPEFFLNVGTDVIFYEHKIDGVSFNVVGNGYIACEFNNIQKYKNVLDEVFSAVNGIMAKCGYTFTRNKNYNKNKVVMFYSPKYTGDMTSAVLDTSYDLLHISPTFNRNVILSQGLLPKSKNNMFKYPEKIHLFYPYSTDDPYQEKELSTLMYNLFSGIMFNIQTGRNKSRSNYDKVIHDMLWNYTENKENWMDDIIVRYNFEETQKREGRKRNNKKTLSDIYGDFGLDVYLIDKNKLPRPDDMAVRSHSTKQSTGDRTGIHFFKDPSFKDGVYTYDHIPATSLSVLYEDITFDELTYIFLHYNGDIDRWYEKQERLS